MITIVLHPLLRAPLERKKYNVPVYFIYFTLLYVEAGRGAAARGVTAKPTGCGFDPHSRR